MRRLEVLQGQAGSTQAVLVGDHHQTVAGGLQFAQHGDHHGLEPQFFQAVDLLVGDRLFDKGAVPIDKQIALLVHSDAPYSLARTARTAAISASSPMVIRTELASMGLLPKSRNMMPASAMVWNRVAPSSNRASR